MKENFSPIVIRVEPFEPTSSCSSKVFASIVVDIRLAILCHKKIQRRRVTRMNAYLLFCEAYDDFEDEAGEWLMHLYILNAETKK